jgi:hypothetical protein
MFAIAKRQVDVLNLNISEHIEGIHWLSQIQKKCIAKWPINILRQYSPSPPPLKFTESQTKKWTTYDETYLKINEHFIEYMNDTLEGNYIFC